MIDRLRAVLDTNVFLSAFLSRNPTSPTKLVTYDAHFEPLGGGYGEVKITKAVPFLRALRGDG